MLNNIKFIIIKVNYIIDLFIYNLVSSRLLYLARISYNNYLIIFCLSQIIIGLAIGFFFMDGEIFIQKMFSIAKISCIIISIRYTYIIILLTFKWSGKFPIRHNEQLKIFFFQHRIINYICVLLFKYVNFYRILLVLRNQTSILLRYIRYFIIKYTVFFTYWTYFESKLTLIFNFIFEYINILISEIYIPYKKKIVELDLKYFFVGRIQFFFLICLTKGMVIFIYLLLLFKLIKLINRRLLNWAANTNISYFNNNLNKELVINSFIFKNLNFNKAETVYLGYNKIVPATNMYLDMGDSLYRNYPHLRFIDTYKGLKLNDIAELNVIIKYLLADRLFVEHCLKNKKLKEH